MEKRIVYIVSDSGHDYSTAAKFGTTKFLFDGKVNVFATDKMVHDIQERLKDSCPEDYFLPSGNSMATCAAFSILLNKHGVVNMLIFSFKNQFYEVRSISRKQIVKEVSA